MIILAVDPGSIAGGWCLIEDGRILSSGVIKMPSRKPMGERLQRLSKEIYDRFWTTVDVLVVEIPPKTSKRSNPADLRGPSLAGGVWIGNFSECRVELVEAGQWIRPMLGKRHTKETSKIRASMEAKRPIDSPDESDAINMGIWWWRTNGCT